MLKYFVLIEVFVSGGGTQRHDYQAEEMNILSNSLSQLAFEPITVAFTVPCATGPLRACIKRLITLDEVKEECGDRSL